MQERSRNGTLEFDLAVVREWVLDDEPAVRRHVAQFCDIGRRLNEELRASDNPHEQAELAHRLRGSASTLGAERATDALRALELAGRRSEDMSAEPAAAIVDQLIITLELWLREATHDDA